MTSVLCHQKVDKMLVVICPNCRHRFPAPGCCENVHRQSESNSNQPSPCYYGGVLVPRGFSGGGCFINSPANQSMAMNSNHLPISGDSERQRSVERNPHRARNNPENRGSFVGDNESEKSGGSFSITTPSIQSGGRLIQSNDWITDSGSLLQSGEIEIRPKLSGGGCLIQKKPSANHADTVLIQESRNSEKKANQQQKILLLPPSGCQELPGIRKTEKNPGVDPNFAKKQMQLWEKITGKAETRGKGCYCNGDIRNLQNGKFDGIAWREQAANVNDSKSGGIQEWENPNIGIFQSGGSVVERDNTWWNVENSENSVNCSSKPRFSIFQEKENPSEEYFVSESRDCSGGKFSIFPNKENYSGNPDFSIFGNSGNGNSKSNFYICESRENCDIKSEFSTSEDTDNCNIKFVSQDRENCYIKSEFPIFENRSNQNARSSNSSNLENQNNYNIASNTFSGSDNKENCNGNAANLPNAENEENVRQIKFDDISISKNRDASAIDFSNTEKEENHGEKAADFSVSPSSLEIQVNATVKLPASFGQCTLNITATTSNPVAKPQRSLNNFNGGGIVEADGDQQQQQQQTNETRTEDNRMPTTPISWLMPCPWNFDSLIVEKDVPRMMELKRLLQCCGWYHEGLSWQQSENLLKDCHVGRWLMRDSSDSRFLFAVSVQTARGPTSVRVHHFFGRFRLDAEPRLAFAMPLFDCPIRMLEYYVQYSRSVEESRKEVWVDYSGQVYSEIYLTRPLVKEVRSLSHLARIVVNRCKLHTQHLPTIIRNYLEEYPYSL